MSDPGYRPEGIGSRLPLGPEALLRPRGGFRWPDDPWIALETGRAALGALIESLDLAAGDRALLPAYVCDAAVEPFRARGVPVDFYRVREDLVPDGADAAARLRPETRLLLVVHYFGFPADPSALAAMPSRPALIRVEDWVPGPLSTGASSDRWFGDYRVMSFHKVLPVPDSGLLVRRAGAPAPPRAIAPGAPRAAFFGRRLAAKILKALCVALAGGAPRALYRPLFDAAERAAGGGALVRMSGVSRRILERAPLGEIVARRRANFLALAEEVGTLPGVSLLRKDLPEGVCPLGLPIRVARRDDVLAALIARRVYAAVHWRLPGGVDARAFPEAARLAEEEITLPIDQRYGDAEMAYVARALREAVR